MVTRAFRGLCLLAALALPATAAQPEDRARTSPPQTSFEASFARFEALPPAPEPAGHVVDLATIDAPVEMPPAATPIGRGVASYYGKRFHGRRTANGERFDMHAMTAAHRTLPFGTLVEVTNPGNGKTVTVRINDRGPFAHGRTIDLSRAAASEIGLIRRGHGMVELAVLDQ
ncbi:septal ring lytic transglycosylase RlpA family protein [Erythrobacter sp.]|jgi:rare lipoprotein A|uniref:septal ring lytic transglycosylase RlpA family protein n=1 Tax=Erythrobacter sp. TaxID=1042 RepID=UPI001B2CCF0E|nr:septal ring lytic transglycosylase RlpA family protein [Erythrobacter sp.]MBO6526008.1 septal ring lytic transglycosylase RlpA family protein [Erythrobacter sp.]MBO6530643.1 septal ring lytic transglycosylase RlpA family protein [Erythrobacter sp.]